jgi:hypothetical protein
MTRNSRVTTPSELEEEAMKMIQEFGGVLIEEFVAGREFTVLVAENFEDPDNPITYQVRGFSFIYPFFPFLTITSS